FAGWLGSVGFAFCLIASGCAGFWDDVTSRDFTWNTMFTKPNPLLVLRDSSDGDKRAKALRALHEPKQSGGSDAEQDAVLNILNTAAATEKQPLCRLAAIESLGHFKDPRAVKGLTEAFYNAGAFSQETATVIRCQALTALGETRNPIAVELLARVVREPPGEGTDLEKQQTLDVRIAAARALGKFSHYQATEAACHHGGRTPRRSPLLAPDLRPRKRNRGDPKNISLLAEDAMGQQTLRIGLIGVGKNTRERHIPGLRALSGIELAAVCNRRP